MTTPAQPPRFERRDVLRDLAVTPAALIAAASASAASGQAPGGLVGGGVAGGLAGAGRGAGGGAPAGGGGLPTWADQMKALIPVGDQLLEAWGRPDMTEAERQDMYTLALAMLSEGYLCHVYMDPKRPVWSPLWNIAYNQGGPNPDYIYGWSEVDPEGVYRISGFRGTNRFVDIAQQPRRLFHGLAQAVPPLPTNDLDDLHHDKDGYFSVILSAQRPAGHTGDWWPLAPQTQALMLRRCSTDWRNDVDARIAIERLDPVQPAGWAETARRFAELPQWITGMIGFMMELVKWYRDHHPTNGLELSKKITQIGGLANQYYYDGIYQIADDEALIVETALPRQVRYWQMLVADDRFCTVDWLNRQSSVNDQTARLDADGKLRVVVSARDPGVPNWLDKADNKWGILQMRFNKASDAPTPTVIKVKLAEVRAHLPKDTPTITAKERKERQAARREAAQFRRMW